MLGPNKSLDLKEVGAEEGDIQEKSIFWKKIAANKPSHEISQQKIRLKRITCFAMSQIYTYPNTVPAASNGNVGSQLNATLSTVSSVLSLTSAFLTSKTEIT